MNASRTDCFRSIALLLSAAALRSTATADASRAKFPREGLWHGEFDVNGDPLFTIAIDRKGEVREIYAGCMGESTGEYFKDYVRKVDATMDALLTEPVPADETRPSAVGR